MTNTVFPETSRFTSGHAQRSAAQTGRGLTRAICGLTLAAAMLIPAALAAPAQGDAYVYRHVNGYSNETVGQVRYEVTNASADRIMLSVTPDKPSVGSERTETYSRDGNWLLRALDNHGRPANYEFASPYPAYMFPLDAGKSWSIRANATVADEPGSRSVRVDGLVLGSERVRVPAGEFDTIKIKRIVYVGDAKDFRTETRIVEIDWYAPALGRSVRSESRSDWRELNSCRRGGCDFRGDWNVFELVEARAAGR
jgi:hypothetical protein